MMNEERRAARTDSIAHPGSWGGEVGGSTGRPSQRPICFNAEVTGLQQDEPERQKGEG